MVIGGILVPLAFGVAASAATLLGGAIALKWSARITVMLGLTAGIVLGVAFFDLLPEALGLAADTYSTRAVLGCAASGFAAYLLLDRLLAGMRNQSTRWRAHLGPASLTLHSLLDGIGIGVAFQISPGIGWAVALAVLTHDVADGINTVSLALAASERRTAFRWLVANSFAPMLGVAVGLVIRLPATLLAPLLAAFAGVFLFIGACELLPRSLLLDPRPRTTVATVAGLLLMLAMARYAHLP